MRFGSPDVLPQAAEPFHSGTSCVKTRLAAGTTEKEAVAATAGSSFRISRRSRSSSSISSRSSGQATHRSASYI